MQSNIISCSNQHDSPYSIDQNLWGRSNECGILEDPYAAPQRMFDLTNELEDAPDVADEIVLSFEKVYQLR